MSDINQSTNSSIGSVFDLPQKSFEIVKNNWQMFAFVNILAILSAFAAIFTDKSPTYTNIQNGMLNDDGFLNGLDVGLLVIYGVLFLILSIFFYAMTVGLAVKAVDGKKQNVDSLIAIGKKYSLKQFGLLILLGLIIGFGFLLLIVPGVIAILRLCMAPYAMQDKDLGVIDSLKSSASLTSGNVGAVAAALGIFILISFALNVVGAIPAVGALLAAIVSIAFSLIIPLRYRELTNSRK